MPETKYTPEVWVCRSDYCAQRGGEEVFRKLESDPRRGPGYKLQQCGCMGICSAAPRLNVIKGNDRKNFGRQTDPPSAIQNYDPEDIDGFIEKQICNVSV